MNYETQKKRNFIALLAVYFAANAIFIMSPAINAMATEMFPDKSYTSVLLVSTISSLCMIPGSLVAGSISVSYTHLVHRCVNFGMENQHYAGDGVVTGYGTVDGRLVCAYAQDFTVLGLSLIHILDIPRAVDIFSAAGESRLTRQNAPTLPSCVYYREDRNYEPLVGDFARNQYALRPHLVSKSIKSQMGNPLAEGLSPDIPDRTPTDISARILKHLLHETGRLYHLSLIHI